MDGEGSVLILRWWRRERGRRERGIIALEVCKSSRAEEGEVESPRRGCRTLVELTRLANQGHFNLITFRQHRKFTLCLVRLVLGEAGGGETGDLRSGGFLMRERRDMAA